MGIARFKFDEGKREEYERLSAQAMEIVKTKDSGTLRYDTYFNDDRSECIIIERYRDSEAAMEHAANLAEISAAVLATVSVVHGELLGEPSEELRAKLAGSEVPHSSRPTTRCRTPLGAGRGVHVCFAVDTDAIRAPRSPRSRRAEATTSSPARARGCPGC